MLRELRSFVSLFKPHRAIQNTLDPRLRGLEWVCLDPLFEGVLSPLGATDTVRPTPTDGRDLGFKLTKKTTLR